MGLQEIIVSRFEKRSGLKVEKILEHRTVQWGSGKVTNFFVLSVAGKKHPAFAIFEPNELENWGFIVPVSKSGLENEA